MKSDAYQFIVWGSNGTTYDYIQDSFFKALQHQGRQVRRISQDDGGDYSKAIFFSMNDIAFEMPVRQDALYIIHNFLGGNVAAEAKFANSNVLHFGIRTDQSPPLEAYSDHIVDIYWATNLLPHEIRENMKDAKPLNEFSRVINWVGSIGEGVFGNVDELQPFVDESHKNGITFRQRTNVSFDENARLIKESYFAPAVVGTWQRKVGFVPCRIFKNISYGQFGVTNSEAVNRMFGGRLIQNSDTRALFHDAKKRLKETSVERLHELMDDVAANHTYLNRLDQILSKAERLL